MVTFGATLPPVALALKRTAGLTATTYSNVSSIYRAN